MAENQQGGSVHLPSVLSDEFGISRSQARMEIATGHVEIDGQVVHAKHKFDMPVAAIDGKEIVVVGPTRHFRMVFDSDRLNDFR